MDTQDILTRLRAAFPNATVEVFDTTGTQDHFHARVSDPGFVGLSRIEQHRLVFAAIGADFPEHVHALAIETHAPAPLPTPSGSRASHP